MANRSLKRELNKYRSKLEKWYMELDSMKLEILEMSDREEDTIDLDEESAEMLSGLPTHLDQIDSFLQEAIEHLGGET